MACLLDAVGLASRGIKDEFFVGVAALEKLVRLSSPLERKMALATEAKSAPREEGHRLIESFAGVAGRN